MVVVVVDGLEKSSRTSGQGLAYGKKKNNNILTMVDYHLVRPNRNPPRHPHLRLFSGASALPWPQEGLGTDSPLVRGLHHAACQLVEEMSTGPCWG